MTRLIEKIFIYMSFVGVIVGIFILLGNSKMNNYGVVNFNNISFFNCLDNEMQPNISKNDLIIVKKTQLSDYHINNIIAYYTSDINGNIVPKVGKVVDGYTNDEKNSYIFMVKSDKSEIIVTIDGEDIIGKLDNKVIPNAGMIYNFIFSRFGFILFSVFPLIILFAFEFTMLLKTYISKKYL